MPKVAVTSSSMGALSAFALAALAAPGVTLGQVSVPSVARPEPTPISPVSEASAPARGPFALLLSVGFYSGMGAGVRVGTPDVGLNAMAGWQPMLVVLNQGGTSRDFSFYSTFQVTPEVYVRVYSPKPATHLGLLGGYRYNSFVGHGGGFGGYLQIPLGQSAIDLNVSWAVSFFPGGEDAAKRDKNDQALKFGFPSPAVNWGLQATLAFFP